MNLKINNTKIKSGFTLVELLIVLLIIGLLSGVTLRAIDMTRERTMFSDTTKKLYDLAKAIAGNPDLISDGRRVDFGLIGDMGRLPRTLDELIKNTEYSPNWNGPYLKIGFLEDTVNPSFKQDAWGNEIEYSPETGLLRSRGNNRQTLTYKVADSIAFLVNNQVSGIITDKDNNPPGTYYNSINIVIYLPDGSTLHTQPDKSGLYQIDRVPIGKHRIQVSRGLGSASPETLFKWVSVVPKSNTPVDFKFTSSFRSQLQYVALTAKTLSDDSTSITFDVFNNSGESVILNWLKFQSIVKPSDTVQPYCEAITKGVDETIWQWGDTVRIGAGGTANFWPTVSINPSAVETFKLLRFRSHPRDPVPPAREVDMKNVFFDILFSDGSEITFTTDSDSI